jgi:iron(II)-dependent oxidoreductase
MRLRAVQQQLCALVEDLDEEGYRAQFHDELSPLGWHLGHCAFIENYWLREIVCGDHRLTRSDANYFIPAGSLKPQRGPALPPKEQLLNDVRDWQCENLRMLDELPAQAHALMRDDYLTLFLLQHHCQHLETMHLALTQRAVRRCQDDFAPPPPLVPAPLNRSFCTVASGTHRIGGKHPEAFDNELPAHDVHCAAFKIATHPVSNAEYLAFVDDGGYQTRDYWTDAGWQWSERTGAKHPDHWRQNTRGSWFGVGLQGAHALAPEAPVYGISYHEARAFAAWAGARLPHEYEWEIACRAELLKATGRVWEWCDNAFHPYPGFAAFPYDEYSRPWFDNAHYSLRGGSVYTQPEIRRASFRNFYTADKRHVLAGLRLAC